MPFCCPGPTATKLYPSLSLVQIWSLSLLSFPGSSVVKNLTANTGDKGLIPESGRSPGEGNGRHLQYSCPEKSHGLWSLVGYSLWGCRESDMMACLNNNKIFHRSGIIQYSSFMLAYFT